MKHDDGSWLPDLNPKGIEVFGDQHRFLLLHGPRKSTKTINAINKICRHLWDNDGAMVGVIGKTLRNTKSSGVWQDLTEVPVGIPAWIKSGIGFEYTKEPKFTADTKMTYFRVRNRHGGESECQVHSLEHDSDVEDKFKSTRFSMIYLPECDRILSRYVWVCLDEQLRCMHIPYDQHQILGDCNPPEEGSDHPLHDMFFKKVNADGSKFDPEYAEEYREIAFNLDDNIWMSDKERNAQKSKYRGDKDLYARYVDGKWIKYTEGGHFTDFFFPNIHVIGDVKHADERDWEIITPPKQTIELKAGWDTGDVNHAWSCICPRDVGEKTAYDVIDELVYTDTKISIEDFAEQVIEKMNLWEDFMKNEHGVKNLRWMNYGDPSMFRFSATGRRDAADAAQIIRNVSNNRIIVVGVSKPAGSVKARISMVKRILHGNQFFVSAQCHRHIEMLRGLKSPRSHRDMERKIISGGHLIDPEDPLKHVFDSCTYSLINEISYELDRRGEPETQNRMVCVS